MLKYICELNKQYCKLALCTLAFKYFIVIYFLYIQERERKRVREKRKKINFYIKIKIIRVTSFFKRRNYEKFNLLF